MSHKKQKKNWRNQTWKDYSSSQKNTFIALCVLLVILLALVCIHPFHPIPEWIAIAWVVAAVGTLYKAAGAYPELMNLSDPDDE